jgi:hypothetical protein
MCEEFFILNDVIIEAAVDSRPHVYRAGLWLLKEWLNIFRRTELSFRYVERKYVASLSEGNTDAEYKGIIRILSCQVDLHCCKCDQLDSEFLFCNRR